MTSCTYLDLEEGYRIATQALGGEPNYIIVDLDTYAMIKSKFTASQRFVSNTPSPLGFSGLKYNKATIVADRYAPGSAAVFQMHPEFDEIDPFDEWVMEVRKEHGIEGRG